MKRKTTRLTQKEFEERANKIHENKYSYDRAIYEGSRNSVEIYCKFHKKYFWQNAGNHLKGKGCYDCGRIKTDNKRALSNIEYIRRAKLVHGDKYGYNRVVYKRSYDKIQIYCNKCRVYFLQIAKDHTGKKSGCPRCNESKGETAVKEVLIKMKIPFLQQHKFKDCRYKRRLRFDFYLPSFNGKQVLIEYQGRQHFEVDNFFGGQKAFEERLKRDTIKRRFAINKGIELIEIPYTRFKSIKKYLLQRLSII